MRNTLPFVLSQWQATSERSSHLPPAVARKKARTVEVNTKTIFFLYINIKGLRASLPILSLALSSLPSPSRTILIFSETFCTEDPPSISGYECVSYCPAKPSLLGGRPSGGLAVYQPVDLRTPVAVQLTGMEPDFCRTVSVGDGKSTPALAVIAYYRQPHGGAHATEYFHQLNEVRESLRSRGFLVACVGDANAHLPSDESFTGKSGDEEGREWETFVRPWGFRVLPVDEVRWTYRSMTDGSRSVVDHLALQYEATSRLKNFSLEKHHWGSDHVGLLLEFSVIHVEGSMFEPRQSRRQTRIAAGSPEALAYARLTYGELRVWINRVTSERRSWADRNFASKAISTLEQLLVKCMDELVPLRVRGALRQQQRFDKAKASILDSLHSKAIREDSGVARKEYAEEYKNWRVELVRDERVALSHRGFLASSWIETGGLNRIWALKNRVFDSFRAPLPTVLLARDSNVLLWRHEDVLNEVSRAVKELVDPQLKHFIGPPDPAFLRKAEQRHHGLVRAAGTCRDWVWDETDIDTMWKYLWEVFLRGGAGGKSRLEAKHVVLAHQLLMRQALGLVLQLILACNDLPEHWSLVLVILALKPGRPPQNLQESYRPIVLAEMLSKAFERAIKKRFMIAFTKVPLHPGVLAYRKGISTGMAIFVIQGTVLFWKRRGRRLVLGALDLKNAYNGVLLKLVEVREWDHFQIRNQTWHLARRSAGGIRYQTRFHGHLTPSRPDVQSDGLGQGKILSPDKFNVASDGLFAEFESMKVGVDVLGRLLVGVSWSDDIYTLAFDSDVQANLDKVTTPLGKLCFQTMPSKLFLLPFFKDGKSWAGGVSQTSPAASTKNPDSLISRWTVKSSGYSLAGTQLEVRQGAKVLGRLLGPNVERHALQARWAAAKATRGLRVLSRLGAFSMQSSPALSHTLYLYFVQSVMVSAVLNTCLTEADVNTLRTPQAAAARRAVWAGKRVPQRIILRELGWEPIEAAVWRSKLGLFESIRARPRQEYARWVWEARMMDITAQGGGTGLCGEVHSFWQTLGVDALAHWRSAGGLSALALKARDRRAVAEHMARKWDDWCEEHVRNGGFYDLLAPPVGQAAEHLKWGLKTEVGLMVTARAGALVLRGNRVGKADLPPTLWHCSLCYNPQRCLEDEPHVFLECTRYAPSRLLMWQKLCVAWSEDQLAFFASLSRYDRLSLLLGRPFPPGVVGNQDAGQSCDLAVKAFLLEVETSRRLSGCPSLTASHADLESASESLIEECTREAALASEVLEEL